MCFLIVNLIRARHFFRVENRGPLFFLVTFFPRYLNGAGNRGSGKLFFFFFFFYLSGSNLVDYRVIMQLRTDEVDL